MYRLIRFIEKVIYKLQCQVYSKVYILSGRKPWSLGYQISKFSFIKQVLTDEALMKKFYNFDPLPDKFGWAYDERVVEYPWTLARLSEGNGKMLDAGSCFNFPEIIEYPKIACKNLTIFTLAPEGNAFWQKGISYHYGDLRKLPFRDNWFDEICSISTLGHVGMDNRLYTGSKTVSQVSLEAQKAVQELLRVLRPGGKFLISVVFGKRQTIEWDGTAFAEQFDSLLLNDLLKLFSFCASVSTFFYKYTKEGWNVSTEKDCQGLEYFNLHTTKSFDPDYAAAARSVALIEVIK